MTNNRHRKIMHWHKEAVDIYKIVNSPAGNLTGPQCARIVATMQKIRRTFRSKIKRSKYTW